METALKTGFLLVWFSINIICPERFGSRGSDGISNERQHGLPTTYLLLFSQRWQLIVVQLQCYCKYVKWIYWTIGLQESHILIYIYNDISCYTHTYIYVCVFTYIHMSVAPSQHAAPAADFFATFGHECACGCLPLVYMRWYAMHQHWCKSSSVLSFSTHPTRNVGARNHHELAVMNMIGHRWITHRQQITHQILQLGNPFSWRGANQDL